MNLQTLQVHIEIRIVKSKEVNDRWRDKNSTAALYWENHTELIINENISLDSTL